MGQPKELAGNGTVTEPESSGEGNKSEAIDENNIGPSPKKSLAFKLAFIGIAASLFVFQLDAMILGIALPVSNDVPLPSAYASTFETDIKVRL
jgi:hypothetical protein